MNQWPDKLRCCHDVKFGFFLEKKGVIQREIIDEKMAKNALPCIYRSKPCLGIAYDQSKRIFHGSFTDEGAIVPKRTNTDQSTDILSKSFV